MTTKVSKNALYGKFGQAKIPPIPALEGFNPDIQIVISQETSSGRTAVAINKPCNALFIAHLMMQCALQNVTNALNQQSNIIDANGNPVNVPIMPEKPEAQKPEVIVDNETDGR